MTSKIDDLRKELDKVFEQSSQMAPTYNSMPDVNIMKRLSERILTIVNEMSKIKLS